MENNSQENALFDRMPLAAMHIRTALGNIYYAAQRLAPPEARDNDPELDKTAAVLYQGYYRLLRLAKDLESLELLQRQEPLPVENTDLKVWLDEIVQDFEGLLTPLLAEATETVLDEGSGHQGAALVTRYIGQRTA